MTRGQLNHVPKEWRVFFSKAGFIDSELGDAVALPAPSDLPDAQNAVDPAVADVIWRTLKGHCVEAFGPRHAVVATLTVRLWVPSGTRRLRAQTLETSKVLPLHQALLSSKALSSKMQRNVALYRIEVTATSSMRFKGGQAPCVDGE